MQDPGREHEFVFEMVLFGIPIDRIDDFLATDPRLRREEREELLVVRAEALDAYLADDFDVALEKARRLYISCQYWGVVVAARPHVETAKKFDGQAGADANRKTADFSHAKLDREIRGSIDRGEDPRGHIKKWVQEYKTPDKTIYRRIEKAQIAKILEIWAYLILASRA